jgi:hypothetical protein
MLFCLQQQEWGKVNRSMVSCLIDAPGMANVDCNGGIESREPKGIDGKCWREDGIYSALG